MKEKVFLRLKIIITLISLCLSFLAKSDSDWMNWNYIDRERVQEIVYDLSIGVFSSMVLIWFIDEIGERLQKSKEQHLRYKLILHYDKLLQLRISQYATLFYWVSTPREKRLQEKIVMPEQFLPSDMKDLFDPSPYLGNGIKKTTVEAFLDVETELTNEIYRFISNTQLEYNSELSKILLSFLEASMRFDCRSVILDAPKMSTEDGKCILSIRDQLVNDADKYCTALSNRTENSSHQLYPYIMLRELMQQERQLIQEYQNEINAIKSNCP